MKKTLCIDLDDYDCELLVDCLQCHAVDQGRENTQRENEIIEQLVRHRKVFEAFEASAIREKMLQQVAEHRAKCKR